MHEHERALRDKTELKLDECEYDSISKHILEVGMRIIFVGTVMLII